PGRREFGEGDRRRRGAGDPRTGICPPNRGRPRGSRELVAHPPGVDRGDGTREAHGDGGRTRGAHDTGPDLEVVAAVAGIRAFDPGPRGHPTAGDRRGRDGRRGDLDGQGEQIPGVLGGHRQGRGVGPALVGQAAHGGDGRRGGGGGARGRDEER